MGEVSANKLIHVAVGVVIDRDKRVLIALRGEHLHMGNRWEFPGGKVELGETVEQALVRELREEIGISVSAVEPLMVVEHDYPEKSVKLDVWWVREFAGKPQGCEGQQVLWVSAAELDKYAFPEANETIVSAVIRQLS